METHELGAAALSLTVYGPLGIMALCGLIVSIKLYLDQRADRKAHAAEIAKLNSEHEAERKEHSLEMERLQERYVTKAETMLEKYHVLAESLNRTLESAMRRYPRRDSGGPPNARSGEDR